MRITKLRIMSPVAVRAGHHHCAESLGGCGCVVAILDREGHVPVWVLPLRHNQPPEGIGETRRHGVAGLPLVNPGVRRGGQMVAIAWLADQRREPDIVEDPAEDAAVEAHRC